MRKAHRILIVEDFKPFRHLIASSLLADAQPHELFECSDGLEAVERAPVLKPDVITMDIGLPHLNGIEAARRIHEALPEAKILFVSQESSPDVLQEARSTGAVGYIHKSRASNLAAAISAIADGEEIDTLALPAFVPLGGPNSSESVPIPVRICS